MITQAEIKQKLPQHLRQFVADQQYDERYTARDQAVWRFVMRELVNQLKASAHPVYFEGLERTGISLDVIPSIDDMNICLSRLGWHAIVVDGFIPPQAFMELQSLRVLAIALDMRSVHHIDYTPAPDIIHEAAGHAPIIADVEYSDYLQRFGEVGMKAVYNQYDLDLYEAVRHLSIVKESNHSSADEIQAAENRLDALVKNPGDPSELALLTRLHWWTVEYGLVGDIEDYKIFGAGLLSSLSESLACLDDQQVKKRPLTVDAITTPYDITNLQPQLFVTKSCRHLTQVLDEYAKTMCYQTGGTKSIQTAIEAKVVTSATLSSGLTVSGKFERLLVNAIDETIYIGTSGPTQLTHGGKEIPGHGVEQHKNGFGTPVGRLCNLMKPLEQASEYELQEMEIKRGEFTTLNFLSGITVQGELRNIHKDHGLVLLMSFEGCTVTGPDGETLFEPEWGTYDMAVGEDVISVFAGSADPATFDVYPSASTSKTLADDNDDAEIRLYEKLSRPTGNDQAQAVALAEETLAKHPDAWLLLAELLPLLVGSSAQAKVIAHLERQRNEQLSPLIDRCLT